MGYKTKVDWCDSTWSPVTGCMHGCEYCYARNITRRFGCGIGYLNDGYPVLDEPIRDTTGRTQPYPFDFTPTFHRYKLDEPKRWKKSRTIFVCSMADLFGMWVPDKWIVDVFDACAAAPQHRYLFLTKNPSRYIDLMSKGVMPREKNFWYGSTATTMNTQCFFCQGVNTFISVEPIMERFEDLGNDNCFANWIIVGAETGNRKGKVIPEKDWTMEIAEKCRAKGTPLFMKESLRGIMGNDFIQEFPWEVR